MAETNGHSQANGQHVVGTRTVRPDGLDKVTGRARFGADFNLAGQLIGRVLRSPHPHARIVSIDTSKAEALPGVKAVVTRDDFPDQPSEFIPAGEMMMNYKDVVRNVMAREKALYEGHAVAAVAATSTAIARRAVKLIDVKYEVLPHVIDVVEAMRPDAPSSTTTSSRRESSPGPRSPRTSPSGSEVKQGDVEAGFKLADIIVEREFKTAPVHQGYIEPHAALATVSEDGSAEVWTTTQGHFIVRAHCARLLGLDIGKVRVTATEIGGGFGGKTVVYLEPLAIALSRKANRPVKMVMSREEVFKASGPTSGATVRVKMGATKERQVRGRLRGAQIPGGCLPGLAGAARHHVRLRALRHRARVRDRLRRGVESAEGGGVSGARRADLGVRGRERGGRDRQEARHRPHRSPHAERGARGHQGRLRPQVRPHRARGDAERDQEERALECAAPEVAGPRVASGFWFNIGGETCVSLTVNEDGTVSLMAGTPDIGGLRASLAAVAADELGVPYDKVRPIIGDTGSLGFNFLTGGSRSAFSGSMAIVEAAKQIKADLCARACKLWEAKPDQVEFSEGHVRAARRAGREGQADVGGGLRQGGRQDRRAHRRRRPHQCPGRGAELRHPPGRSRGGSGDRARPPSCATPWPRTRAGRCTRPTSRASIRAARCRGSAGR